jgi:tRNA(fMet)-specific endonuclease VapC
VGYLLDTGSLAEVLRSVPSRGLVRRLTTVPSRDRWTSVISVSQILVAARKTRNPKVMQDVIRLVAAVKVAPFDMLAAQSFAKFRATVAAEADTDDVMIAAIAVSNDFTLVTRRPADFARFPHLRVEDWVT